MTSMEIVDVIRMRYNRVVMTTTIISRFSKETHFVETASSQRKNKKMLITAQDSLGSIMLRMII